MGQYLLYVVAPILVGVAAQRHVHATFARYAAIANRAGRSVLEAAAFTYVVTALASALLPLYYAGVFRRG